MTDKEIKGIPLQGNGNGQKIEFGEDLVFHTADLN